MRPNGGTSGRRCALSNPLEFRQFGLANADGQKRGRTVADNFGSSEIAGRRIFELLHTHVLLSSFDHERKCTNFCLVR